MSEQVEDFGDVSDALASIEDAVAALRCADSCETLEDFEASVEEARGLLRAALDSLDVLGSGS